MVGNVLFIFVHWGLGAIAGWQKNSHFPYLALAYTLAFLFGLWKLFTAGHAEVWLPFLVALYGLYVVSGGFYWLREEGDPEIMHFDWRREVLGRE